jgi:leucyl-tRNA---protein transferase
MGSQHDIRVYQTAEHACGYWPDRLARDLVLDPIDPALPSLYPNALALGFRRSGGHVYRPHCVACRACVAVRVVVDEFRPTRSQRRCLARNADVAITATPARRTGEAFDLYRRYVDTRHVGGGMDAPMPVDFDAFLACAWSPTEFLELRRGPTLLGVAVTDVLPDALSAVYTFFAPEEAARSLGTFAILSQIARARREERAYLYLGFWLDGHRKMDYKRGFAPLEYLDGREWKRMGTEPPVASPAL